jgi:hypothetical protein
LKGPWEFIDQYFRRRALHVSAFILLQRSYGTVEGLEQKSLTAAIAADDQIDRRKFLPVDRKERAEVFQFDACDHNS